MAADQVSFSTPSWRAPSDTLMTSPATRPPRMILFQFTLPPNQSCPFSHVPKPRTHRNKPTPRVAVIVAGSDWSGGVEDSATGARVVSAPWTDCVTEHTTDVEIDSCAISIVLRIQLNQGQRRVISLHTRAGAMQPEVLAQRPIVPQLPVVDVEFVGHGVDMDEGSPAAALEIAVFYVNLAFSLQIGPCPPGFASSRQRAPFTAPGRSKAPNLYERKGRNATR